MRVTIFGLCVGFALTGCGKAAPATDPHVPLVEAQVVKLGEVQSLLKGVTDEATAANAKPKLTELRQQVSESFDQEKRLGAWPRPDMQVIKRRNAAVLRVFAEWTRLLPLRGVGGDIRAITDDWDGLLTQLKASLVAEAGQQR